MSHQQKVLLKQLGIWFGVVGFIAVNVFLAAMTALLGGDIYHGGNSFLGNLLMIGSAAWVVSVLLSAIVGFALLDNYNECMKDIVRYGDRDDPQNWMSAKCFKYVKK